MSNAIFSNYSKKGCFDIRNIDFSMKNFPFSRGLYASVLKCLILVSSN
jgi:hypothetical protein